MQRLVIFCLVLLIIIAFFFGLNLGKKIQSIDTPTKVVITKVLATLTPRPTKRMATPSATVQVPHLTTGVPSITSQP